MRALIVAFLLLVASAASASAQIRLADWAEVTALPSGTPVRVRTADGRLTRGVLAAADATILSVVWRNQRQTINRSDVVELRRRRPNSRDRLWDGAAIGGAVGVAWGAGVIALIKSMNEPGQPTRVGRVLFQTVGFSALTGFFVDALIGERYDVVYRR